MGCLGIDPPARDDHSGEAWPGPTGSYRDVTSVVPDENPRVGDGAVVIDDLRSTVTTSGVVCRICGGRRPRDRARRGGVVVDDRLSRRRRRASAASRRGPPRHQADRALRFPVFAAGRTARRASGRGNDFAEPSTSRSMRGAALAVAPGDPSRRRPTPPWIRRAARSRRRQCTPPYREGLSEDRHCARSSPRGAKSKRRVREVRVCSRAVVDAERASLPLRCLVSDRGTVRRSA